MGAGRININVDMGESFGNYVLGEDEALIEHVPTVNIACGFHAGDPHVMRRTVELAVAAGVEIGAHVGLPDMIGFGRRRMEITPGQLYDYVVFQYGALDAFVRARGSSVTHVKPHGVLYAMIGKREDLTEALLRAVADLNRELRVIVGGEIPVRVGAERGIVVTNEGYVDLDYRDDGWPIVEARKRARDPDETARRAVGIAVDGTAPIRGRSGSLQVDVPTICLHGDTPDARRIVAAVRAALEGAGVEVVGLDQVLPR